jgi:arylformamidase
MQARQDDWIDVSVPVRTGMVHWPDDPPITIERVLSLDDGHTANVSQMSLGVHTGTHMDAPSHFLREGLAIDAMPIAAAVGPARVIAITDPEAIRPDELMPHQLQPGERVLFKTRNSDRCWRSDHFVEDFVFCSREAAAYLAGIGITTVGVDYLSVGGYHRDGAEVHHILLEAGIWIIEGLNLASVAPGSYDMICLPLRLVGCDGAPARAVVRPAGGLGQGNAGTVEGLGISSGCISWHGVRHCARMVSQKKAIRCADGTSARKRPQRRMAGRAVHHTRSADAMPARPTCYDDLSGGLPLPLHAECAGDLVGTQRAA